MIYFNLLSDYSQALLGSCQLRRRRSLGILRTTMSSCELIDNWDPALLWNLSLLSPFFMSSCELFDHWDPAL